MAALGVCFVGVQVDSGKSPPQASPSARPLIPSTHIHAAVVSPTSLMVMTASATTGPTRQAVVPKLPSGSRPSSRTPIVHEQPPRPTRLSQTSRRKIRKKKPCSSRCRLFPSVVSRMTTPPCRGQLKHISCHGRLVGKTMPCVFLRGAGRDCCSHAVCRLFTPTPCPLNPNIACCNAGEKTNRHLTPGGGGWRILEGPTTIPGENDTVETVHTSLTPR